MKLLFKTLATFFLVFSSLTVSAQISAAGNQLGKPNSITYHATVVIPENQVSGKNIYFALLFNNTLYFWNESTGFVPYTGQDIIPAVRQATGASESFALTNWDIRSAIGGLIFVGYGNDAFSMVDSGTYRQVGVLTSPPEIAYSENSFLYCYNPYSYINTQYVAFKFDLVNDTPYAISRVTLTATFSSPGIAIPVTLDGYYDIPGGIAPGARTQLSLQPNMFSDFAITAKPYCGSTANTLNVKINSATSASGQVFSF